MTHKSTVALLLVSLSCAEGAPASLVEKPGSATTTVVPSGDGAPGGKPPTPRPPPAAVVAARDLDSQDVTAAARALDRGRYPRPSSLGSPHPGGTLPSRRAPKLEQREPGRFTYRLPDPLPLPTPTVHGSNLLVGTGLWLGALGRDGSLVWGRETTDMGPSSAACERELCAFSTYSCTVIVVEADSGRVRSNTWLGPTVLSAPAIDDGVVYASYEVPVGRATESGAEATGGLAAIDLASGEERWRRWLDRNALGAPVVGDAVHVTTWGGTLFTIDKSSGAVLSARARYAAGPPTLVADVLRFSQLRRRSEWTMALHEEPAVELGLFGDDRPLRARTLLLEAPAPRGADQRAWLYPDARGSGRWPAARVERWPAVSPVSRYNAAPYSHHDLFQGWSPLQVGDLTVALLGSAVVALRDAAVVWTHPLDDVHADERLARYLGTARHDPRRGYAPSLRGFPPAVLSASPTRVVAATLTGRVLILDAASGGLLQTVDLGHPVATQVALADGWLYAGTLDGRLVAVDTGDGAVDGWRTFAGNARRTGHPEG